jgi:hypothetical protein
LFGAFGNGGFVWAWEKAKLWNYVGIESTPWSDSAPGVYAGAGVEIRKKGWSLGLVPRYTVLFDNVPKTYKPGREMKITYADSPSQFVDVLFRVKYSF